MTRIFAILGLVLIINVAAAQTLTVFAASSLTESFTEIAKAFEAEHEGVEVRLNFAGSSTLSHQIVLGAPADVFASANEAQMEVVVEADLVAGEPQGFAGNKLIVITPANSDLDTLEDLTEPGTLLVLAGPEVPVGAYSRKALEQLGEKYGEDYAKRVLNNLVSEEPNVRQTAAKVELGEADAAIVYTTDAAVLENVKTIEIPDEYNVLASYPIAVISDTEQAELARAFVDFVLSDTGQAILRERGFIAP